MRRYGSERSATGEDSMGKAIDSQQNGDSNSDTD